jgi:hypothetical protein
VRFSKLFQKFCVQLIYFEAIQKQLNCDGYEALLYDLLYEDTTSFNPRILPASTEAFEIKMRSADSAERYIYAALCEGSFSIGSSPDEETYVWQSPIPKKTVYDDYVIWCRSNGEKECTNALFGKALKKCITSVNDCRPGGSSRSRQYTFPPLKQAREEFCKAFKENDERIFGPGSVQE